MQFAAAEAPRQIKRDVFSSMRPFLLRLLFACKTERTSQKLHFYDLIFGVPMFFKLRPVFPNPLGFPITDKAPARADVAFCQNDASSFFLKPPV
jgi:hypothetical protein